MADDGRARRPGEGAVRRPGRRRLRRRAGGRQRPPRPARAAAAGRQRRAGAAPRGRRADARAWPSGTPAAAPTCCGSPCRPGTPPPRSEPSPPPPPADATAAGRGRLGRPPAGRPSSPTSPTAAAPRAVWAAAPGDRLADAAGRTRPPRPSPPAAARCSACPTSGRRTGSTPRSTAVLGDGHHVALTRRRRARPRATATSWRSSRGARRVVVGTRAAAFAPVHDLGLVAIWDDGDDLHAEPRAPYPHAREVLLLRAEQQGTAVLVGGFARTVEAAVPARTGWAHELGARPRRRPRAGPGRSRCRRRGPRPACAAARMPRDGATT